MQRREFLKLGGLAIGGSVVIPTASYAIGIEPTWIELRRVPVSIRNLPAALNGLRVVQISDIHRSSQVSAEYVAEAVQRALLLEPELVILTGDFVTHDARLFADVAGLLAPLAAVAPTYAVPGNHDYDHWYTWAQPGLPDGGDRLGEALARHDIHLLRNQTVSTTLRGVPDAIELVGLDDLWSERFDAATAFTAAASRPGQARLVLCHNPDAYQKIEQHPFDLMLCGHTHGGQVQLPLVGVPYAPIKDLRFIAGLTAVGPHQVYTNRGLGWNRRIRLGVRPELTLLTLGPA